MDVDLAEQVRVLGAELAATKRRLADLEADLATDPARSGRRDFLKLAVVGAAAGAAGAAASSATPAAAATGGNMIIGSANVPTANAHATVIESPSATELAPVLFKSMNHSGSATLPESNWRVAMYATSCDADASAGHRVGVAGEVRNFSDSDTRGIGVFGAANRSTIPVLPLEPIGVLGMANSSTSGTGVKGWVSSGSSTIGVHGLAATTVGVQAEATGAGGVGLNATAPTTALAALVNGRMRQVTAASPGAPSFSATAGEQWRDSNGDLFLCVTTGSPGTWRKVVAQHPDHSSAGGSVNLLANPIRVLDTRPGQPAPQNNGGNPLTPNTDLVVTVTGVNVGGVLVPTGAKGIIGNLTVVPLTSPGYLTLWAENVALPGTSNLNFYPGVVIANSYICALSPGGKVRVRSIVSTHVLLDIVGFLY